METVAGIFRSRAQAESAVQNLVSAGVSTEKINLLTPGTTPEEIESTVPTTETEQPGMGSAIGGTVGGAIGIAGGMQIGAAAASLFIPGVGPIFAAGLLGAALLGAGGAATGAVLGGEVENNLADGIPHDELYIYEDALRQGRTVIVVIAEDGTQADAARAIMAQAGAESLDAARESWWVGLRDAEAEHYRGQGGDLAAEEARYRSGFVAALDPATRSKSYDEANEFLRKQYGEECSENAFKCGYERGQAYHRGMVERYKG
ncbi:MAG TPA: hypothetical protein VK619_01450 [Pyrinomonadaceae bacterium]|nr:hypothetical protein [Pyrinomonadaceae bacterium]